MEKSNTLQRAATHDYVDADPDGVNPDAASNKASPDGHNHNHGDGANHGNLNGHGDVQGDISSVHTAATGQATASKEAEATQTRVTTIGESPPNWSDPNTATATPQAGHRAPPPTPAALAAALEGKNALEPVPEDDAVGLSASPPKRSDSPLKKRVAFEEGASNKSDNKSSESDEEDVRSDVASEEKLSRCYEFVNSLADHIDGVAWAEEDLVTNLTSGASTPARLSPKTATVNAFDLLADKSGNKGLDASKYARPAAHSLTPNSSRARSALNPLSANFEVGKYPSRTSTSFQEKAINEHRKVAEQPIPLHQAMAKGAGR